MVTGGDDGFSGFTYTSIYQNVALGSTATHEITFDWSYTSGNDPSYDGAFWDLVDIGSGLSVVGGPITLTDTSVQSRCTAPRPCPAESANANRR